MYTFMEYNSVCTDIILTLKGRQLQWQSEQHQPQQEAAHIQHRAHLKNPHRLSVRVQHQGQAHQRRASRHLPHQSVTHSHAQRRQQSRQHQRLQLQRQARLQGVLNQKLRQQKRMHPSEQAVQIKQKRHSQHHRKTAKDAIHSNFLPKMLKKA